MSETTNNPEPGAGERIEQFLAAVDRALGESGMGAEERQNVQADLSAQIEEMLAARVGDGGKKPTVADVDAVLGELDPPESYSQNVEGAESAEKVAQECGPRHVGRERGPEGWRGARCGGGARWFWGRRRVAGAIRQAMQNFGPFADPAFAGLTPRARRALMLAKGEAFRMNHQFIGTEHLLLGLIVEGEGVGGIVLRDLGVELERARKEAIKLVGPGREPVTQWLLPVTPRTKQTLDLARMESRNMGHDYVGTEHLLLGISTNRDSVGFQMLANLGISPERLRAEVVSRIPSVSQPSAQSVTYWPAGAAREIKVGRNVFKIIAGGGDTGGVYSAVEGMISGSDGLGMRRHSREEISIYLLEGPLRVRVEERMIEMGKGDFVRIPRGVWHEIQFSGETARVMIVATPAGVEKMYGEMGETPEAVRDVAGRFGVESS